MYGTESLPINISRPLSCYPTLIEILRKRPGSSRRCCLIRALCCPGNVFGLFVQPREGLLALMESASRVRNGV